MRILHTSDWHIGHRLYERSRIDEHRQFLDWLLDVIQNEQIDALLVSGDIFDSALPSAESTDLYYKFLFRFYEDTDASAVIIAGNHDSAIRLAAPREFLKMARIHVVGGISDNIDEYIITLGEQDSKVTIAAVPYLSEGDILSHISFESQVERACRYREALKELYSQCISKMPLDVPKILMGHFFIQGGEVGKSERAIQIGGTMLVRTIDLPENVDYVALGHLHRPQQIRGSEYSIIYSGSPLPMTFRESTYSKKLYIFDIEKESAEQVESITIPVFKELCRVSGNFDEVMTEARSTVNDWKDKYIEVQLRLDTPFIGAGDAIRNAFAERGGEVLVVETQPADQDSDVEMSAEEITTKSPEDIFEAFYKSKYGGDDEQHKEERAELMTTFKELLALTSEE